MKKWETPILNDLSVNHTNESVEHYALNDNSKSTWICSCGNTYGSVEALNKHIEEFWPGKPNGTEHGSVKLS